jgi:subtilisin family serine protease
MIPAIALLAFAHAGYAAETAWPPASLARKLDPALLSFAIAGADSASVWVCFRDKSAGGPAAEAASLAGTRAALSPRSLERRIRAHVTPLVDAADLPVPPEYLAGLRARGLAPFAVSRWLNRAAVRVSPGDLERIAECPFVSAITPVRRVRVMSPRAVGEEVRRARPSPAAPAPWPGRAPSGARLQSPPVPSSQSGLALLQLAQIGATALHDSGYVGTGELIAVLDDGFNFHDRHDALRSVAIAPGFSRDFVDGDTTVTDTTQLGSFEHGTMTFGCIAGYEPGVYLGSAYGAQFALARTEVATSETPVEMLYWSEAAEWADSLGADIISSSLGYNRFDSPWPSLGPADLDGHTSEVSRAAEIAASKGILVVNSAGNGGDGPPPMLVAPADVNGDSLIAVGAVDSFGVVADFSSRGPTSDGRIKPDLMARGEAAWVVSASGVPDEFQQWNGTSFSAPLIAGLAACLLEARPAWSPTQTIRALRETASSCCGPDNVMGWGIPNGARALGWTPGPPAPELPPTGYVELALQGANPAGPRDGPMVVRFGLGPRFTESQTGKLRVFDATGRLIRELYSGSLSCGRWHVAEWAGEDRNGRSAPSGIYFVNLYVSGRTQTARFALIR